MEEWPAFERFNRFVVDIAFEWKLFSGLYFDEQTVRVLNRGCGEFFYLIQDSLYRSCLVRLCALTDPPETGKSQNLSLGRVVEQAKQWLDSTASEELDSKITQLERDLDPIRLVRNKVAVHIDSRVALGEDERPTFVRSKFERCIEDLFGIVNIIHAQIFDTTFAYDQAILNAPNDVIGCVKDRLWTRHLRKLAKSDLDDSLIREFASFGYRSIAWNRFCLSTGVDSDCWLDPPKDSQESGSDDEHQSGDAVDEK